MYVKRLTLHGFKSFAHETTFEFGHGVTAIVGPNGSGKSNIADAVRWVLGEQGLRLLRARKQEEVIYAGAGDRAPLGMAEVTLTLDNADHTLPIDFTEVEIGRRTYRDGDTEYLLNGSRIRLRDLQDLLTKANVGQNSYAIMGQGMVDEVLSRSPQDRRSLIDEAADVKRFRQQIAEAHTRLASTRENMEKVRLVIDELEPRLRLLRRQADRASEHQALSARLATLLGQFYASRWSDTRNAIMRVQAELDQRGAEDEAAESRVTTLEEQMQALGDEIARRREAVSRHETARGDLDSRIVALDHALALDRERHAMTSRRHSELQAEIEELQSEQAALPAPDSLPAADASERDRELDELRAIVARNQEALERTQREYADIHRRAEELRGQVAVLDERIREQTATVERASLPPAEGPNATRLEARRMQLLVELTGYGRRFAEQRERITAAEAGMQEARQTATDARTRLDRVQNELRDLEVANRQPLREIDQLRGRLEALKRVQAESEGVATGTRNALIMGQVLIENVRPGSLGEAPEVHGLVGLLSRYLSVPAGLEAAINAALEHHLHAIIIEQESQALQAIDILRERASGRAQFLPLDTLRRMHPLNLQKERGVIGVASRLIRCEQRYRDLVDTLLGRIIVVEDIATARRMLGRGLGALVTRDGVFLDPSGVITGGYADAPESPFSFARQREIEEIPPKLAELEQVVETQQKQIEAARETAASLTTLTQESDNAYVERRATLDAALQARQRERDQLHRLRREMVAILARHRELAGATFDEQAAEDAAARLAQLTARKREAEQTLAALAAPLEAVPAQLNQAVEALAEARARLTAAEREAQTQFRAREQQALASERLASRLADRTARAGELVTELDELAEAIERREGELEPLRLTQADSSDDTAPDRDEILRLEAHERSVQAQYAAAQAALLDSRRRRLDLDAQLDRSRERLETIRAEMESEGLTTPPAAPDTPAPASSSADGEPEPLDLAAIEREIESVRRSIRKLGPINQEAPEDFRESEERHTFLLEQTQDLTEAEAKLQDAIAELNGEIRTRFSATFEGVDSAFREYFTAFFGGGSARLILLDPDDIIESGIEIEAQPPRKRLNSLNLLSGGERSLTAVALLFALLSVNPAPFCVLDEVDAALDEANVGRFVAALGRLADRTQFLVVTHNRLTIESTDAIYGISMGPGGASTTLSLRLSDLPATTAPPSATQEAPPPPPAPVTADAGASR